MVGFMDGCSQSTIIVLPSLRDTDKAFICIHYVFLLQEKSNPHPPLCSSPHSPPILSHLTIIPLIVYRISPTIPIHHLSSCNNPHPSSLILPQSLSIISHLPHNPHPSSFILQQSPSILSHLATIPIHHLSSCHNPHLSSLIFPQSPSILSHLPHNPHPSSLISPAIPIHPLSFNYKFQWHTKVYVYYL